MKAYEQVIGQLTELKMRGMINGLDQELNEAERGKISYIGFLSSLLDMELNYRIEKRYQSGLIGAHFPIAKDIDGFDFGRVSGISKMEVSQILEFHWLDNHHNLLFFGLPGLGKTHLAISIGLKAVEKGYTVSFERMTNLIRLLKTSEVQRTSLFRLNRLLKSDLVIIDEIGYTPIERKEANLFFNLVSEMYEKRSIIITSNKDFNKWAEMMGDEIMTVALLDRLIHHSKIIKLEGPSFRTKDFDKEV